MSKLELPSVLPRIRVKSPCEQDWDTMQGNDRVRFCDHCAKYVHDLSEMTPDAALELVEQSEGRLCVRYIPNPDGSPKVHDPEPTTGGLRLPNPRLAAGVLAAALTMGVVATPATTHPATTEIQKDERTRLLPTGPGTLVVTVIDQTGAAIEGAKVTVRHPVTGRTATLETGQDGEAAFRGLENGFYKVEQVSSPGFQAEWPSELYEVGAGDPTTVKCLLQEGVMLGDVIVISPTHGWLAHQDQRAAQKAAFVEANPDTDFDDFPGREFFEILKTNNEKDIRKRLKARPNLNVRNRFGDTPLLIAIGRTDEGTVTLLINAGAEINTANQFGVTPLMYAALYDAALVNVLLNAGANPNAADDNGRTALMLAAFDGKLEVVNLLVNAGADINARDAKGQSALDYALAGASQYPNDAINRVIAVLKNAGAVER